MGEILEHVVELFLKVFHWGIDLSEGKKKAEELKEEVVETEHHMAHMSKAHDKEPAHAHQNIVDNMPANKWAKQVELSKKVLSHHGH